MSAQGRPGGVRAMNHTGAAILVVVVLVAALGVGLLVGLALTSRPAPAVVATVVSPSPSAAPSSAMPTDSPSPSPTPTESPSPTPVPTPVLVPDPLDGLMVSPALASRHVVAVMIDDLWAARPQSGLSAASVVWQAPAEGGIPRYMALFSEGDPPSVGPIRSSRLYFIAWAAEWKSVYAHVGGSPQALALLRSSQGRGSVVYNADEISLGDRNMWRVSWRPAPHNMYSDAKHLRALVTQVKAKPTMSYTAHWQFAADAPIDQRPVGGSIVIPYPQNVIRYAYDRNTNTYLRSVSVEGKQVDKGTGKRIAPKNVVVMAMSFAPLNDGTLKHRLEAQFTGSGTAWISTNGKTVKGRWKKASMTAPTLFYGPNGKPVTLTAGQTFVNVVPIGTAVKFTAGKPAPAPTASPSPSDGTSSSPSPSAGASPSPSPVGYLLGDAHLAV